MLSERISKIIDDENFFSLLYEVYLDLRTETENISLELANAHNDDRINLVGKYSTLVNDQSGENFFLLRRLFDKAMPNINHPVHEVMDCVKHLTLQTGHDLFTTTLIDFLIKDEARVSESINISISEPELIDFLSPALVAGSKVDSTKYFEKTIALIKNSNLKIKNRSIYAISMFDYDEPDCITDAFQALAEVTNELYDDELWSMVLYSAVQIYKKNNLLKDKLEDLFNRIVNHKDESIVHTASRILWSEFDTLPKSLVSPSVDCLKSVKIKNADTLNNIDYCLEKLGKKGYEYLAIELLEEILISYGREISINAFSSFCSYIQTDNDSLLSKTITKWLASRNLLLCRAVMDLVEGSHSERIYLKADMDILNNSDPNTFFFVAKKAIGWLFTKPVSSASFIISILDDAPEDELPQIIELLFHPLLINYTGLVGEYFKVIKADVSESISKIIDDLESRLNNYHDAIRPALDIPELKPPQTHREIHIKKMNRDMSKSYKEAQKGSIIDLIASKSVILYGLKSINYIHRTQKEKQRQVTEMHSFGTSIEFPRLGYLDPQGLDYLLRMLRVEDCH